MDAPTHHDGALAVGSFDMFHVGHLSALRAARSRCRRLVVAVADDALVQARRGSAPTVAVAERVEVVSAFFPDATVESVPTDRLELLAGRFGVSAVAVAGPDATDGVVELRDGSGIEMFVVPHDMTASPALLRSVEADVLWTPA